MLVRLDIDALESELNKAAAEIAVDVANELVNQLKIKSPVGATGTLQESWQIFRTEDNIVWMGTRVPYAKGVWKGKPPHEPDFQDIKVWARRKLGDESAAGPVYSKIKAEGTEPNPFVDEAIDEAVDRVGQMTFGEF
jgi:hypothetical protein